MLRRLSSKGGLGVVTTQADLRSRRLCAGDACLGASYGTWGHRAEEPVCVCTVGSSGRRRTRPGTKGLRVAGAPPVLMPVVCASEHFSGRGTKEGTAAAPE